MMRKLIFWFLGAFGLAGWVMFEVARWPAYKAVAHAWVTGQPIERASIPPESLLPGMAMVAFAIVAIWITKRWQDRHGRSPPPRRPALRLVS